MLGTQSIGIPAPIYRGDGNIFDFICNALQESKTNIEDGDIIGITESLVARSQNNYCTVDDIAKSVKRLFPDSSSIFLYEPIASRNRFSLILKGIARAYKEVNIIWQGTHDEVGNNIRGKHPFTGLDYRDVYRQIVESEGSSIYFHKEIPVYTEDLLNCKCHPYKDGIKYTLRDVMNYTIQRDNGTVSGFNTEFGVLGSNVAGEDRLKLFPREGQEFVIELQKRIKSIFKVNVDCLIYGDGCFKDPVGGIWEFADPMTCPGSTIPWERTPVERKLKYLAETKTDEEIIKAIRQPHFYDGEMGTTPRRLNDLLASLMDLTSGSGDKGTPIVHVKNYFTHYGQG